MQFPFEPVLSFGPNRPTSGDVLGKAADAKTYAYLRQFDWYVSTQSATTPGAHTGVEYKPNDEGYCWIDASDVQLRAESSAKAPGAQTLPQ